MTGEVAVYMILPSGMVCGGDTVVLPIRLFGLFSESSFWNVGEDVSLSLLCVIVDTDVRDGTGGR